jgi:hypothetical protein
VRTRLRLIAIALVGLVVAGCGGEIERPDGVAATVDGVEVSRTQLETGVRDYLGDLETLAAAERADRVAALQRQLLGFQIQGAVFERVADEQGVVVEQADLDAARGRLLEATGGEAQLEQLLLQEGLTPTLFEELILPQEVRIAELAEVVGPDQINPFLVDALQTADVRVAPGLGEWSAEELRVVEAPRVGRGTAAVPGIG